MHKSVRILRILAPLLFLTLFSLCENGNDPTSEPWLSDMEDTIVFEYPSRTSSLISGTELADSLEFLALYPREKMILTLLKAGHVPAHLRTPVLIEHQQSLGDSLYTISFYVSPDYLSLGTDEDFFRIPMTPILAQKIMDEIDATLPTRKMVDLIWQAAPLKLEPTPIPPSAAMTTVPVFIQHEDLVDAQVAGKQGALDLGALVAGHKKDVVLSNRIASKADKVVIYGWHWLTGSPIQPLYSGHVNWYADYSHGVRSVLESCEVNGERMKISEILRDKDLYVLLSDESGPMPLTRYDTSATHYP